MANSEQIKILMQGVKVWNKWRDENVDVLGKWRDKNNLNIDLRGADLHGADLKGANLRGYAPPDSIFSDVHVRMKIPTVNLSEANLSEANLKGANLQWAKLSGANLQWAKLSNAHLQSANLRKADLRNATLMGVDLERTNLSEANLSEANLMQANFNNSHLTKANLTKAKLQWASFDRTNLEDANLSNSQVYGISAWNVKTNKSTQQLYLVITNYDEPIVTVDNLEIAQFIYLLLHRENLRNVLNTITSKSVLILGRFTPERKVVLDAIANELRESNLIPIIFDFERSTSRDFTETIKVLAGMSLFVIADITNPKSAPLELQATVPDYQIPFVPIIEEGEKPFSMFSDLPKYDWVLTPVVEYPSLEKLLKGFKKVIIDRAWKKHQELQKSKAQEIEVLSIDEFWTLNEEQTVE